ncbi:hypothetical protein B0H13DRAFT_2343985 [Mycena leptocephala]|nr:hypothetical protein B0H13DRAFT_2343985 [Mycena leptocephala]
MVFGLGATWCPAAKRLSVRIPLGVALYPHFHLILLEFIAQGHHYDPPLRVVPLCAFLHQHPIPLRIRARFNCPTALTALSRWPSPPRSWICLSAPRSRIIHRGSCAEPQTSSSFPRALTTLELSRWVSSARLPFAFARRPLLGAGYTSRSHPTLPLRVRRDALAVKQARIAFLLLMRAQRDPFAPVKQLWLLHHRTCASWMERRADGDGMTIQMHVDEDGEARGRGWECRWRWNAALALVPALAFPLVPALRERRRRCRLGEIEKRGCGCGCGCGASTSFPSPSSSASPSSALVLVLARVIMRSSDRGGVSMRMRASVAVCADTEGASSADLGLILGLDAQSHVDDGADVEFARVRHGCAYNLLSLALAPISLSFSLNSVGSLFYTIRCMPSLSSPIHVRTAIALNETSS